MLIFFILLKERNKVNQFLLFKSSIFTKFLPHINLEEYAFYIMYFNNLLFLKENGIKEVYDVIKYDKENVLSWRAKKICIHHMRYTFATFSQCERKI